jgi:hypothetical protein
VYNSTLAHFYTIHFADLLSFLSRVKQQYTRAIAKNSVNFTITNRVGMSIIFRISSGLSLNLLYFYDSICETVRFAQCTHPYLERRSCRNVSRVGAGACAAPILHRSSPSALYRLQIKDGFAMSSLLLFRTFHRVYRVPGFLRQSSELGPPQVSVFHPQDPTGGRATLGCGVRGGGTQFGRLDRKAGNLFTLWNFFSPLVLLFRRFKEKTQTL